MKPKKHLFIYTPHNPTRPSAEKLLALHNLNLAQNNRELFDYEAEEVVLPLTMQNIAYERGRNVVRAWQRTISSHMDYKYIGKWDDDVILPPNTIQQCLIMLDNDQCDGVGIFEEDYGAPNILAVNQCSQGWDGAFSRFYIYKTRLWRQFVTNPEWVPERGKRCDGDNPYQREVLASARKHVLNIPSIHLDHRCLAEPREYKVLIELAMFLLHTL